MEILKLKPVLKSYIWGGTKLITDWGKGNGNNQTVAESWELSLHNDGKSTVFGGKNAGKPLSEVITPEMLGTNGQKYQRFPLLIKLIDAAESLSVQVHPNDEYALKNEDDYGKTEMWYICDSEKGGGIYIGFNRNVSKDEVRSAINGNKIEELLNFVPVKKGDCFLIEAGTIHAIRKGVTICEIQQNSNVTYRVYDYDRTDKNGNKRELHIEKALSVLNYSKYPNVRNSESAQISCKYFNVKEITVKDALSLYCTNESFNAINIIEGKGSIDGISVSKGDTLFVPSNYGEYALKGGLKILLTSVN